MAATSAEPQRFGKYQILERIAAGGMAEIFKARLDGIGGFHRTFAIKRILPHLTQNAEFVDMLVEEAKIAGLLSHANIVQILDLGNVDHQYYIAMEYVAGRDLGKVLQRCAEKGITLPVPHAVFVVIEMLKGLDYAHHRQVMRGGKAVPLHIVHRDISPANVLLSFQGEVKLTDFGIAKASIKALQTMSGVVKGRFDYMSPEQARAGEVDQRSDLFSVGVMLYELLTGRHPFRQRSEAATIDAVKRGVFEPPSAVNPDVPPPLDAIVAHALRAEPGERFADAGRFKEALDAFFHESGFIFSASTLAAFLRGLFPEAEVKPAPERSGPTTTRPLPPKSDPRDDTRNLEELLLDEDVERRSRSPGGRAPTRPAARPALAARPDLAPRAVPPPPPRLTAAQSEAPTAAQPTAGGRNAFAAGMSEAATVVRPPSLNLAEWGEAATVVRPTVPDPAEGADRPTVAAGADRPTLARRDAPPPPRAPGAGEPRIIHKAPSQLHLFYLALAFTTLVAGFAFGVLAGTAGARRAAQSAGRVDPTVEVIVPEAARVTVDGVPVTGASPRSVRLKANTPAQIRVEVPGATAVETTLSLDHNQTRVLDFTPATPKGP